MLCGSLDFACFYSQGLIQGNAASRPADMPPGGQVHSTYIFPEHPSKEFPAGDWVSYCKVIGYCIVFTLNLLWRKGEGF